MMDEQGVWAHMVYPNTVGFGGQRFASVTDTGPRRLAVEIYNDAMADIQEESGGRLRRWGWSPPGTPRWPWPRSGAWPSWACTASTPPPPRMPTASRPGIRLLGPRLGVASEHELPVNFHIGASESDMAWYGTVSWPSLNWDELKLGLGSAMLYINNAAVIGNMIYSGVLERFPTLQVVSVESGVGWIPFVLRALDYQVGEMVHCGRGAPGAWPPRTTSAASSTHASGSNAQGIPLRPSRCWAGSTSMFETHDPHPTCTYPHGLEFAAAALCDIPEDATVRQGVMGANVARASTRDIAYLFPKRKRSPPTERPGAGRTR